MLKKRASSLSQPKEPSNAFPEQLDRLHQGHLGRPHGQDPDHPHQDRRGAPRAPLQRPRDAQAPGERAAGHHPAKALQRGFGSAAWHLHAAAFAASHEDDAAQHQRPALPARRRGHRGLEPRVCPQGSLKKLAVRVH